MFRRLTVLLRREGWMVNAKRVYRLYDEENLKVRSVERKTRAENIQQLRGRIGKRVGCSLNRISKQRESRGGTRMDFAVRIDTSAVYHLPARTPSRPGVAR